MSENPTPYKVGNLYTNIFRKKPDALDFEDPPPYGKRKKPSRKPAIIKKFPSDKMI